MVSKITTVLQMVTIVYVLFWSTHGSFDYSALRLFFFCTTALFTVVSGLQYLFAGGTVLFRKEIV